MPGRAPKEGPWRERFDPPLGARLGAELVGTFTLVFAGCGAVMVDASTGGTLGHVGVCATFGLAVMVMVYATGHLSGAHLNPAVTLAFATIGRMPWREVLPYAVAQLLAAMLAATMLRASFGDVALLGATTPSGSIDQSLALEVVLTFVLMFVITSVATDARAQGALAGVAIGGAVALGALMGGPISGASMNPARSLGPAFVAGEMGQQWVYVVAPLLGAALGAWAYRLVRADHGV